MPELNYIPQGRSTISLAFFNESRILFLEALRAIIVLKTTKSKSSTHKEEAWTKLFEAFGNRLKLKVPLASYTTFGIGGRADLFFVAEKPEELVYAVRIAQKLRLRFMILGGGSNVLISDSGFRGLVIKNECQHILTTRNTITAQSGALLGEVVKVACESCLSGLEFVVGIPGTVGGAIRGNAGAFGGSIGDVLTRAVVLTEGGEIKEVDKKFFQFQYRESRLKRTKDVLLSATFELRGQAQKRIEERMAENLKKREESFSGAEKSAGCFFKNLIQDGQKISAGYLLDQVGAKEMREGDARVFAKHANILINAGSATATQVRRLAEKLKERVKAKFDLDLQEEVVYIN